MIRIGEVHCHWCGDAFEPEGLPSFEGPNFCSDGCGHLEWVSRIDWDAYCQARYGGARVF